MSPWEYLHVSMWIWTWNVSMSPYVYVSWSVYMSPCGYGHGVSPCLLVDMNMESLHISM